MNKPAPLKPPDIEAAPTDFSLDVTPLTIEEIKMSIRKVKSWKEAGHDNIPAEALKKIWEEKQVPTDRKEGCLFKIPKKGDLGK
ncbi:unnamed protein product [Schistosoma curassoni]|uniref:HARE-HTH domain-containing protein n=1 Tax=Schistosoma curassoni TaxID=6186 RepID=A0A183KK53_9TREM|nr:unnamed protein product [Schistosoma curassoni]